MPPMIAARDDLGGVLDILARALGADRVLTASPAADEMQRRSLNPAGPAPQYLVRPRSTEECRIAVEALAARGCAPDPIASLTTFWEPHPAGVEVGLDTLDLRTPCRIDAGERIGYFGAGITVREVDRLARAEGLCLVAYPDSDGGATVGSLAAVGCTTGLGIGRMQPVEQIAGLTVVTRDAAVVRTGAAWRRGRGGMRQGLPDPTGLFLGSQGRSGVITEVVLALWPAPFLAASWWASPWSAPDELARQLRRSRSCLDRGTIDSLRLETVCSGRDQPTATEWFVRCWSPGSTAAAAAECDAAARALSAADVRRWQESPTGRRGMLPDHDQRYSVPPGAHHERTGREGFLGIEVTVNWGEQLDQALPVFTQLFAALAALGLAHRRLGIYPSAHAVAIGVQAMVSGGEATGDVVRSALGEVVPVLNALGAVPYRPGRMWDEAAVRDDPAAALIARTGLSAPR